MWITESRTVINKQRVSLILYTLHIVDITYASWKFDFRFFLKNLVENFSDSKIFRYFSDIFRPDPFYRIFLCSLKMKIRLEDENPKHSNDLVWWQIHPVLKIGNKFVLKWNLFWLVRRACNRKNSHDQLLGSMIHP